MAQEFADNMVLSEAKTQLKMNQPMMEMLKGNTRWRIWPG
jgi:hypothetical protein